VSGTLAVLWLSDRVQLRLEIFIAQNEQFRLELRRWQKAGDNTWRLPRKRGVRVERGELTTLLKAVAAGNP